MRIYKNRWFVRFARKEDIDDGALCDAIARAEKGLVDADLGSGLIKQRIARPGEGRSGGFRTIVAFRANDRAFFVYGFAKNERDNIDSQDLRLLKVAAASYLTLAVKDLERSLTDGKLFEVVCHD